MPYFPPQQTALDILNKIKTVDGSGSGLDADTIDGLHADELSTVAALNDLTDVTLSSPSTNQVLLYNGSVWVNGTITSGVTDHGALTGLADDDHAQYLLANGTRTGASSSRQVFTNGITTGSVRPSSDSTTALQLQNAAGTAVMTLDTMNSRVGIGTTPLTSLHLHNGIFRISTSSANQYLFQGFNSGTAASNIGIALYAGSTSNAPYLWIAQSGNNGWGGPTDKMVIASSTNGASSRDLWIYANDAYPPSVPNLLVQAGGYVGVNLSSATALLDIAASNTTRASLRIRSGTSPISPNDGDIWFDGSNLKIRIGGVTKTFTVV